MRQQVRGILKGLRVITGTRHERAAARWQGLAGSNGFVPLLELGA